MTRAVQWGRSALFVLQMYLAMVLVALAFALPALASRDWALRAAHVYCAWVRWTARWMIGLRSEIRGTPPTDPVLIAAKHQSFFDIIMIVSVTPRPKFIMKRSLRWTPFLGWIAMRMGCIPVDRGRRAQAIDRMLRDVARGREDAGQLIIYPQGTRVAPFAERPYKIGAGALYDRLGQDCVPAATNVGVFWPRRGLYRAPGTAVVEFLPRIPTGRPVGAFMSDLEAEVEAASLRLMAEAGAVAPAATGRPQAG